MNVNSSAFPGINQRERNRHMTRTALRRGGRLIVVTALATAFAGAPAGADEHEQRVNPDTPPVVVNPETQPVNECKTVTLTRDANLNYSLTTSRTGTQSASATVHGDASVALCVNLDVTVGATVNIGVDTTANADAGAMANAVDDPTAANDTEQACVSARVDLAAGANASATATGSVSVSVSANASAAASTTPTGSTGGGEGAAQVLVAPVDESVQQDQGTPNEFAATRVCVDSSGTVTAS